MFKVYLFLFATFPGPIRSGISPKGGVRTIPQIFAAFFPTMLKGEVDDLTRERGSKTGRPAGCQGRARRELPP